MSPSDFRARAAAADARGRVVAARFPAAWATILRHLGVLKDADLISPERNGNSIRYEVNATVIQELIEVIYDWTKKGGKRA